MKRNTIVLGITLLILATFAWAGWANWEYRKQAAERALASASHAELVPSVAGDVPQSQTSLVGKPAPDFVLENVSGQTVSLSSFKGKPLLINFWATWCGPCKIETPWLIELQNEYASKGFQIVGISTEGDDLQPGDSEGWARDKTAIAKFVKEYHMQYPVLVNGDEPGHEIRRPRCHADFGLRQSRWQGGRDAARHHVKRRHGGQHRKDAGTG